MLQSNDERVQCMAFNLILRMIEVNTKSRIGIEQAKIELTKIVRKIMLADSAEKNYFIRIEHLEGYGITGIAFGTIC